LFVQASLFKLELISFVGTSVGLVSMVPRQKKKTTFEEPEISMDHFQKKVPDWLKSPLWLISGNSKNIPMVNHLSVQTTLFWCQKSQDVG
jgi:hypothetical protein